MKNFLKNKPVIFGTLLFLILCLLISIKNMDSSRSEIANTELSESALDIFEHQREIPKSTEGDKLPPSKQDNQKNNKIAKVETTNTVDANQQVLDWAAEIGFLTKDALSDVQSSDKTYRFLEGCSKDPSIDMVYRALCAANMERLYRRYPDELGQIHATIKNNFPEEINSFINGANLNF